MNRPVPLKQPNLEKEKFFTPTNILYLLRKPIVHAQKENFLYLKKVKKN